MAQVPYFPPMQSLADFSDAACARLLGAAAGAPLSDLHVRQVRPWTMHAQVAEACVFTSPSHINILTPSCACAFEQHIRGSIHSV